MPCYRVESLDLFRATNERAAVAAAEGESRYRFEQAGKAGHGGILVPSFVMRAVDSQGPAFLALRYPGNPVATPGLMGATVFPRR